MIKAIEIELFRISNDSKYIDMIFNCPVGYYFTSLQLIVKSIPNMALKSFDLSPALFVVNKSDEDVSGQPHVLSTVNKRNWTVRIPLAKLGIETPSMCTAILKAIPVYTKCQTISGVDYYWPAPYSNLGTDYSIAQDTDTKYYVKHNSTFITESGNKVEALTAANVTLTPIDDATMICSDVNFAYRCILDDLLKLGDCCEKISDDAIRNYLILYGHQSAMAVEDITTAESFFKIISKCFNRCDKPSVLRDKNVANCNCGRK